MIDGFSVHVYKQGPGRPWMKEEGGLSIRHSTEVYQAYDAVCAGSVGCNFNPRPYSIFFLLRSGRTDQSSSL